MQYVAEKTLNEKTSIIGYPRGIAHPLILKTINYFKNSSDLQPNTMYIPSQHEKNLTSFGILQGQPHTPYILNIALQVISESF